MKGESILSLSLLLTLLLAALVSANSAFLGNGIQLLEPLNGSFDNDSARIFFFNVSGNTSRHAESGGYTCQMYTNNTGTWAATGGQITNVSNASNHVANGASFFNATNQNATLTGLNDGHLSWTFGCFAPGNSTVVYATNQAVGPTVNNTLIVDATSPIIAVGSPRNATWHRFGNRILINLTVSDNNAAQCVLSSNINATSNTTVDPALGYNHTQNLSDYINGTQFFMSWGNLTSVLNLTDNNTGAYLWNAYCNDSAGNARFASSTNLTFFVDATPPTQPNQTAPTNYTKSTDRTPSLTWLNTTELNFSLFQVQMDDNVTFLSPEYERNITTHGNNYTVVTSGNLSFDVDYYWRVTAYDLANNTAVSALVFTYRVDDTCGTIVADIWNICAITNTVAINASTLCDQTSCAFVAQYNSTHEFQTHTSGSSTFDELYFVSANDNLINESSIAFIYTESTNKSWENRTWSVDRTEFYYNLTNHSTGWNIVPILNQTTIFNFDKLERSINGRGAAMSVESSFNNSNRTKFMSGYFEYNESGSKYVPYVANRSFNNNTNVSYGDAVWVHFNRSVLQFDWNSSLEIS